MPYEISWRCSILSKIGGEYANEIVRNDSDKLTIKPKKSKVLVFEENGETVFTRNPVTVNNPGGEDAQGGFEEVLDIFLNQYFKQSFLKSSGLSDYIKNPKAFKTNLRAGAKYGKGFGYSTGYKWIANAVIA